MSQLTVILIGVAILYVYSLVVEASDKFVTWSVLFGIFFPPGAFFPMLFIDKVWGTNIIYRILNQPIPPHPPPF